MRPGRKKLLWIGPLAIVALAALIALGGEIVSLLWNWLLPPLFGWHELSWWQGVGILALCRILFGGLGFHGRDSGMRRRIEERMIDRWERMTPEERERFRQGMRGRYGSGPSPSESQG